MNKEKLGIKIGLVVLGALCMGVGIATAVSSTLGADPLALLWDGVAKILSINLGQANWFVAFLMLLPALVWDRSQIGFGTIVAPIIIGLTTNYILGLQITSDLFFVQMLMMLSGLVLLAIGIGMYASANLGRSSYDSLLFMLNKKTNIEIGMLRSGGDLFLCIMGVLLGGKISLGPIVAIFLIGPVMQKSLIFFERKAN